jgi:phospholipase C
MLAGAYCKGINVAADNRRIFLKHTAAGLTAGALPLPISRALALPGSGKTGTIRDVEHVVILMQENRSFDHYFGMLRGVRGFSDPRPLVLPSGQPVWHQPGPDGEVVTPFRLDSKTSAAQSMASLDHSWKGSQARWNNHDAWIAAKGPMTMGHFTREDLPFYYALADAFTICDAYHCSIMGPTHPNRLMALSGTIDPDGKHGGPVLITNDTAEAKFSVNWTTVPELLEDKGVSWKTYTPPGELYRIDASPVFLVSDAILPYFSQYSDPSSALYQKAFLPTFPDTFTHDVRSGTLPSVSWVIPPLGYDEHPPSPPSLGAWYIDQVLKTLTSNPKVWSKTVLFVMYDENDGFFDHVPPPVAPPGTPGEYVTVNPLPATAQGVAGPMGLGFRVPMLVVSPFSRGGYVSSETFDHTSQIRLLEERFGIHASEISAWRRKTVGDLTSTLRLGTHDVTTPKLPSTSKDTTATVEAMGCSAGDLLELDTSPTPYPQPAQQTMPTQEKGTVKRLSGTTA